MLNNYGVSLKLMQYYVGYIFNKNLKKNKNHIFLFEAFTQKPKGWRKRSFPNAAPLESSPVVCFQQI